MDRTRPGPAGPPRSRGTAVTGRGWLRAILLAGLLAIAGAAWRVLHPVDPLARRLRVLDGLVRRERLGRVMADLSREPHRAGTPANGRALDAVVARLRTLGLDVGIEELPASLPEPVESSLTLVEPDHLSFDLREKRLSGEAEAPAAETEIPFCAWAPDADVTAPVVFGNFGTRDDYAHLKEQGISPAGKIVLLRAPGICRSMKAILAAEEGVAGLLLYPDPRDEGFRRPSYPEGTHANSSTVPRGSMLGYFLYPGDPEEARARGISTLPRVPALPISPAVAEELLRRIGGPAAPDDARGALAVSYRLGPGPATVRLVSRQTRERRILRNVTATLRSGRPEAAPVVVGAHVDAWVYGATDPVSGAATVLEAADALARLTERGLRLGRDVVFVFFDGEEYGMLGSTGWVSRRLPSIVDAGAFVYVDSAVRAPGFGADVMPGLRGPLEEILPLVRDPETEKTLWEIRAATGLPGFSGDTSPFQGLAGVPCAEIGFGFGRRTSPLYHSAYDGMDLYGRLVDPEFRYTALLSKILALYVSRLAEAPVFPLRFTEVAPWIEESLAELAREHRSFGDSPERKRLSGGAKRLGAVAETLEASDEWRGAKPDAQSRKIEVPLLAARACFRRSGAAFADSNLLVGPSGTTGCGAEALPGLARALRSGNAAQIEAEARALELALDKAAALLSDATLRAP